MLQRAAASSVVYLLENDSKDDTADKLQHWCAAGRGTRHLQRLTLSTDRMMSIRCPERGNRMAYLRNILADRLREEHKRLPVDYVLVVDMDLECYVMDGVLHSLGQQNWDMLGANGILFAHRMDVKNYPLQYDAWAFREQSYRPMTCMEVNPRTFTPGSPLCPVLSCFGGVGLYRAAAYVRGSYVGGDCEHVGFHRTLRENGYGRHFLNPSMLTFYNGVSDE